MAWRTWWEGNDWGRHTDSWEDHDEIVMKAMETGYDPNATLDPLFRKTRLDSRSGVPARSNPLTDHGSTRSLQRTTTDEAIEEEKKDWTRGGNCYK